MNSKIEVDFHLYFTACRKTFDTLLDFEKGSYIFRAYNRRHTKV